MTSIFGIPVISSPFIEPRPVLKIRDTFEWCSDEVRDDMNKWLLEMFGKREVAYFIGSNPGLGTNQQLIMSPRALNAISVVNICAT